MTADRFRDSPNARVAMCQGKIQLTQERALKITNRGRRKGRKTCAYHCPLCGFWHVGSTMTARHDRLKIAEKRAKAKEWGE